MIEPGGDQTRRRCRSYDPRSTDWWREGVVYQVYPRSFADSDGDGIGDLPGIIGQLDYLGPGRSWRRRDLAVADLSRRPGSTSATTSATTPRSIRVFGTDADFDRLVAEAHRRGMRVVLDLVMNHTSDQHRWFEASRQSRDGPVRRLVSVARSGRLRRDGRPLPPNNWVSFFGGPAWTWEPRRGQFYHAHVPARAARPQLAQPGGRGRPVRDGPRLARPRRRRLPARRLQRLPQAPGPAAEPAAGGADGRGPARSTSTTGTSPTSSSSWAASGRSSTRTRGGSRSASCSTAARTGAAALTRERPSRVRLGAGLGAVVGGRVPPRRSTRASESSGRTAGRPSSCRTTTSPGRRRGSRRRPAIADDEASPRRPPCSCSTLRGTPFLYYGEEIGMIDVADPGRRDRRSAGAPSASPGASRGGTAISAGRRCRGPRRPGGGFTTGRPWLRMAPTPTPATWRDQDGRSALGPRMLPPAPLARGGPGAPCAPARFDCGARSIGRDVLAWIRGDGRRDVLVVRQLLDRRRATSHGSATGVRWKTAGRHASAGAGPEPSGRRADLRALEAVILVRARGGPVRPPRRVDAGALYGAARISADTQQSDRRRPCRSSS